jgi:hypothetical protein
MLAAVLYLLRPQSQVAEVEAVRRAQQQLEVAAVVAATSQ